MSTNNTELRNYLYRRLTQLTNSIHTESLSNEEIRLFLLEIKTLKLRLNIK